MSDDLECFPVYFAHETKNL